MTKPGEWWRRFRFLLRRDRLTEELDEELRLHIDLRSQANRRLGMTDEEAARAARRAFGNPAVLRETSRESWGWLSVDRLIQDVRYGARQLLRHRTWTAAAILTLALGIGANTAMFSAVNALMFKAPAPIRADGLAWLMFGSEQWSRPRSLSYPAYLTCRERKESVFGHCCVSRGSAVSRRRRSRARARPRRVRQLFRCARRAPDSGSRVQP